MATEGDRHHHCGSKIEPEQARKRRSEHDADDPGGDSGEREYAGVTLSRVQPCQPDRESQGAERGELVLADERALSAAVRADELDRGPDGGDARVGDDDGKQRRKPLPRVDESDGAEGQRGELDELPRSRDGFRPVGERGEEDQRREGGWTPSRAVAGTRPGVRSRRTARTATTSRPMSAGPIEASVPATPTSTLGRSRARSRQRTTVTRKMEKEGPPPTASPLLAAGWA